MDQESPARLVVVPATVPALDHSFAVRHSQELTLARALGDRDAVVLGTLVLIGEPLLMPAEEIAGMAPEGTPAPEGGALIPMARSNDRAAHRARLGPAQIHM